MKEKSGIPYIKMHGAGNDYIYIDALKGDYPYYLKEENLPDLSRKISDRHFGVGSDGLIIILPSSRADFRMRIFNSDGSEAKMCGNGIRCVGKYVYDLGYTSKKHLTVETNSGIKSLDLITGEKGVESVIVDMGSPFFKRGEIPVIGPRDEEMNDQSIFYRGIEYKITGISMGNPHGVIFVEDPDKVDIEKAGPFLERLEIWPDKSNIEFVRVKNPNELMVRVWERGSGETLACGTGACASAVVACRKGLSDSEVKVHLKGGDLKIIYDRKNNTVLMEGPAEFISEGVFFYPSNGFDGSITIEVGQKND